MFCLHNEGTPGTLLLLEPMSVPPAGDAPPPLKPMASSALQVAWRLSVMVQRSAEEMVGVHVANKEWSAALEVAHSHRMDCDFVYKCAGVVVWDPEKFEKFAYPVEPLYLTITQPYRL